MDDPVASPPPDPAARLSRRDALQTYAPPTLAAISVVGAQTLATSGPIRVGAGVDAGVDGGGIHADADLEAEADLP